MSKHNEDNWAMTRPSRSAAVTNPIRVAGERKMPPYAKGCLTLLVAGVFGFVLFLLTPIRTNVLILGLDAREPGESVARADTLILTTIVPLRPEVGILSVPRDLWVTLPNGEQNRINAAHVFAELEESGAGPQATIDTISLNFGVEMHYFVRLRFEGLRDVVDALGGVDVEIPQPMSGYAAGTHHMDGEQALAFVRDRAGSDDFFRMERGQLFLKALMREMFTVNAWQRIPKALGVFSQLVETDIPVWQWLRLGLALFRAGPEGIENHIISRDHVIPFTTEGGASVLGPDWEAITPLVSDVFGKE